MAEMDGLEDELDKYMSRADKTKAKLKRLDVKLEQFQNECAHNTRIESDGYLVCDRCDYEIGRLCPTSPTHICEFNEGSEDNTEPVCIYCGKPDDVDEDEEEEPEDEDEVEDV